MPQSGAMPMIRFSWHVAFASWDFGSFALFVLVVLVALAAWYLRAEWKLAARGRRWPATRRTCFLAGLLAVDLAFQSSVALLAGTYFQAHIVQHLLLMVVAPPLLALGAP
ncbi:MAG TPA: cytochrome c oxidase assembly protein, partial [Acidimicrobiales bacterium]|nr:cytochrome c oxidase assembly protein [Acidimicrobiales bacterium]